MIVKGLRAVFTLAVVLLLLGGAVIVAVQMAGLIAGQGGWLTAVARTVEPPTLAVASLAGILAFVLSYQRGASVEADEPTASSQPPHV